MVSLALRKFLILAVSLFAPLIALAPLARADAIPGAAGSALPETSAIATDMLVSSIHRDLRQMRRSEAGVVVGRQMLSFAATGGGEGAAGMRLTWRELDSDVARGSLITGTALAGMQAGENTLVFAGLVLESLDADVRLADSRLKNFGYGIVAGVDHQMMPGLDLVLLGGLMALDYETERDNGAVTGDFDAKRSFVELAVDYRHLSAYGQFDAALGLLWMSQSNDGYTESDGSRVESFDHSRLSLSIDLRNTWGQSGQFQPYAEASLVQRLSENGKIPERLQVTDEDEFEQSGRLGIGLLRQVNGQSFDFGVGANFGNGSYSGMDARLSYSLRF